MRKFTELTAYPEGGQVWHMPVSWRNILHIDLDCVRYAVRSTQELVPKGTRLMAVVKADAYGHGARQVAYTALEMGATDLAVATVEEGLELRNASIQAPILILSPTDDKIRELAENDLTGTVSSIRDVEEMERVLSLARMPLKAKVHLKIDTGMNRIGVRNLQERNAVLEAIEKAEHVHLTGVFTHLCVADDPSEDAFTREQIARFHALTDDLPKDIIRHCANSAGILRFMPEAAFDMVRMGIILYGYPPCETDKLFIPGMEWISKITHIKQIAAGESIGYGRTFVADRPMTIATVSCGYGDGYHRAASGKAMVWVKGELCPVVGRICMDQMMVDITPVMEKNPDIHEGTLVYLMRREKSSGLTAEDVAKAWGTISYEVILAPSSRVDRVWEHDMS
ncbi:MAG: alanine racemase [Clostridia bacterium]|nr:alanine racemase [Clostridia bacterium]